MCIIVIKRDGRKEEFNRYKIINAILDAVRQLNVDEDTFNEIKVEANNIADEVFSYLTENDIISVEQIQDMIEESLISNYPEVQERYHNYRLSRTIKREKNSTIVKNVMKRVRAADGDIENSNANVDERSFSGREKEASSDIFKHVALEYSLSPEVARAHKTMLIYQHDLEKTSIGEHNCLNIDFERLLKQGFETRNGDVRRANSLLAACQLFAVIFQCQSQVQFGGVGSVHADIDLGPYVKKSFIKHFKKSLKRVEKYTDEMIRDFLKNKPYGEIEIGNKVLKEKFPQVYSFALEDLEDEGKQAAQGLYHNLNTLESRAGSQVNL